MKPEEEKANKPPERPAKLEREKLEGISILEAKKLETRSPRRYRRRASNFQ